MSLCLGVCVCVRADHVHTTFQKMSCALKSKMVCHNNHLFMKGCTVTLSNLMLDDGTNCNVHEVVTVIDLYICLGPLYICVIIFDSLRK